MFILKAAALALLAASTIAHAQVKEVDPFIGTTNGGNTFPGASLPFGMTQWSPDTTPDGWYQPTSRTIHGFSVTHLSGVGCPAMADMPFLPWSHPLSESPAAHPKQYTVAFNHANEEAHPGFYSVTLADGTKVELTVTDRAGIARLTYPAGQHAGFLLNAGGGADTDVHMAILPPIGREHDGNQVRLDGKTVVAQVTTGGFCGSATRYTLYTAFRFKQAPVKKQLWQDNSLLPGSQLSAQGKHTGIWLDFGGTTSLLVKVGLSYTSARNAIANLDAELPGWDFDATHAKATTKWDEALSKIDLQGGTPDERTIAYTALYHTLLTPTLFSDFNRQYVGFDRTVHTLPSTQVTGQYANFSDWDIYRSAIQFQALLYPRRTSDMIQSLVNDAEQIGSFPRWPLANDATYVMGGDSPPIVIASAYAFGARNFDVASALKYMREAALVPTKGLHGAAERIDSAEYLRLGYVPTHPISASVTLEYASSDFAISQMAAATGDEALAKLLRTHAENWRNLLDPQTRWIRPRNADGTWLAEFDPVRSLPHRPNAPLSTDQMGFEEGNTQQYSFMIPFDYQGLFDAMGGEKIAIARLDKFFTRLVGFDTPTFNMANEPDFVTPYAYAFAGVPAKTAEVVTRIEHETFNAGTGGIPGNDDLGATSSWYLWSALGLYPAIPGTGGLVIGTPMFPTAKIHLGDGRTLLIHSSREAAASPETATHSIFVQRATLNGKEQNSSWLPLSRIGGNSALDLTLGPKPSPIWGKTMADRPPSLTKKPFQSR